MPQSLSCNLSKCDPPCQLRSCHERKKVGEFILNRFNEENTTSGILIPKKPTLDVTSAAGSSEPTEVGTVDTDIGDSLLTLTIYDSEGKLDVERISTVKFQNKKVAIELERLETLLRQSERAENSRESLKKEIIDNLKHEIKKLMLLILED